MKSGFCRQISKELENACKFGRKIRFYSAIKTIFKMFYFSRGRRMALFVCYIALTKQHLKWNASPMNLAILEEETIKVFSC